MGKIKTFRGKLADEGVDRIYLAGGDSDKGYRITKFEIIAARPGSSDYEYTCKIYSTKQTLPNNQIDFDEDGLLAAAVLLGDDNQYYPISNVVIFDREVVNQDIFVTNIDTKENEAVNYYIEMEEVKMSANEQAVVNFRAALIHGE